MSEKHVSSMVIRRLPRYYRYLGELLEAGITRVSSRELSEKMKASASQIRQDLNCFGGFGQQGYGYNVEYLHSEIGQILGLQTGRTMIIIGAGNLGKAIAGYGNFSKRGFTLKGLFDVDKNIIGSLVSGVTVQHISEIKNTVKKYNIDIAVLTVPRHFAQNISDELVSAGIRGIWNFTHADISVPENVSVENVHLSDSLMTLSCRIERNNTDSHNSTI